MSRQAISRSVSGNVSLETRWTRKRETMGGFSVFVYAYRVRERERDSLTLRITLARADRFQAGLSTLSAISLWYIHPNVTQQNWVWLVRSAFKCFIISHLQLNQTENILYNSAISNFWSKVLKGWIH